MTAIIFYIRALFPAGDSHFGVHCSLQSIKFLSLRI